MRVRVNSYSLHALESFVSSNFDDLYRQKHNDICDSVFVIGSGEQTRTFHVVSSLIALQSPVMRKMLFGGMKESQKYTDDQSLMNDELCDKKYVRIEDITMEAFDFLIAFCYGLNPTIECETCADIYYLSSKYMIKPLEIACFEFIESYISSVNMSPIAVQQSLTLNADNNSAAATSVDTAVDTALNTLIKVILKLHSLGCKDAFEKVTQSSLLLNDSKAVTTILQSDDFQFFPLAFVEKIVSSHRLLCNEETIWERCVAWAQYQTRQQSHCNSDEIKSIEFETDTSVESETGSHKWSDLCRPLLKYIRFIRMDSQYLTAHLSELSKVLSKDEIISILSFAINPKSNVDLSTMIGCSVPRIPFKDGFICCMTQCNKGGILLNNGTRLKVDPLQLHSQSQSNLRSIENRHITFVNTLNNGINSGIHRFSIRFHGFGDYNAFGFTTDISRVNDDNYYFWDCNGYSYFIYCSAKYLHTYNAFNHISNKIYRSESGLSFINGIETRRAEIDCDKGLIRFFRNGKLFGPIFNIEKNKTYFPVVSTNTDNADYEIICD